MDICPPHDPAILDNLHRSMLRRRSVVAAPVEDQFSLLPDHASVGRLHIVRGPTTLPFPGRQPTRAAASGVTSHATKCSSPFIASVTAKPWSGKYCTPRYAPVLSLGDSEVAGGPAPPALASVISATSHSSASAVSWCPSVSSTESSESFTFNDADALELEWGCTLALAGLALAALLPRGLLLAGRSPLVVLARDGLAAGRPTFRFRGGG
eukprot:scaffold1299_cov246-Pinguiococcus_pyrenoidosus.AAC.13